MNFSLIIPLYNSNYIDTQIKSILNLKIDGSFLEIIFVDDGSEAAYQEKYKRFILNIRNKNIEFKLISLGNKDGKNRVCEARNTGVRFSKFENLIFIDQETILQKKYLGLIEDCIRTNTVVLGPYFGYNNLEKKINQRIIEYFIKNGCVNEENFQDFRIDFYKEKKESGRIWEFFGGSNFFIKKSIFKKVGGFDEKIITWGDEDVDFGYRLHKAGYNIIFDKVLGVLNLSEKLYSAPFKMLEGDKIELLSNNWLLNYDKHKDYEYKRYILDRFNHFDSEEKAKVSGNFKKWLSNKKNVLIHAMNGIGLGHIKRTILLALKLRELDEIGEIIFVTNSSSPFLIISEGFKVEKLDYGIENTLQEIPFSTYEEENFIKINRIIQENNIDIIIHDTFFIKKLLNERGDLTHFLILRDSELDYLNTIRNFLPRFRKIFIPHIREELSPNKLDFYSRWKNILYIGYVIDKDTIEPKSLKQAKKKKILVSPGYGGDYENTLNFLKYINDFLCLNKKAIEDYEVEFILGKHSEALKEKINFSKKFTLLGFKGNLSRELGEYDVFIGRGGYNTVNEVVFNRINSFLFSVDRFAENQDDRIAFFIKNFSIDFIKKGSYDIQSDSLSFRELIADNFEKGMQNGDIFNGVEIFLGAFKKEISKKNILVFKHIFLPLSENFIFEELSSFKDINPIIFTFKSENIDFFINNFQLVNRSKFKDLLTLEYPKIQNNILYIEYLQYLIFLLKKHSINIIYTEFLFDAFFISKIKFIYPDIKIISAGRGYDVYAFLKNNYVDKTRFLNTLDRVLVRDSTMKKELMNYGLKEEKLEVVRSVLDFSKYHFRKKDFSKLDILFGGRFTEKKQLPKLLDLIKLLNDKNLLRNVGLVGDGELRDEIIKKIAFLGLKSKIKMYGFLRHKDLFEVLDNYNCFISYSSKGENGDDEAIPNLISENILSGNIVFSTITGGLSELLKDDETGIILSGNPSDDLLKIQEALNKNNFEFIVRRGLDKAMELLSPEYSSKKLENFLKTI